MCKDISSLLLSLFFLLSNPPPFLHSSLGATNSQSLFENNPTDFSMQHLMEMIIAIYLNKVLGYFTMQHIFFIVVAFASSTAVNMK